MVFSRCILTLTVVVCAVTVSGTPLEDYLQKRSEFIADQENMRFDSPNRGNLTKLESKVNATLCSLRDQMRNTQGITATPFRLIKDKLRMSPLYKMLHTMPKGGLLHLHWDSTLPIEFFVKNGTYRDNCYIFWDQNSTDANSPPFGTAGFFNPGEEPVGYKPAALLRKQIPNFDDRLEAVWDVLHNETTLNESIDPWGPFSKFFVKIDQLFFYKPVFMDFMTETLLLANDEWGVQYLELRSLGYKNNIYDLNQRYSAYETVEFISQVVDYVKSVRPGFGGVKLIYSQYRLVSSEVLSASLAEAYNLTLKYPNMVIGYDLVGQEDSGHTLRYFVPQLLQYAGKMDFYFHAGETDIWGNGTTSDNINDAVLLKTKRIGHGLAMSKLPLAAEVAKRDGIALEVCPLSNQGLEYVLDVRDHPAASLLSSGNPIVLSNDDPAILDTCSSLAFDWSMAVLSWDIDLASIKTLIFNSIQYSSTTQLEKQSLLSNWQVLWHDWLMTVAATHNL
eukprot:TRINITY_DN13180_c1_g1_i1.p1 TRINITY_DN13180_c1_g1~~TRINITY_DN13180_c1_g1_i1.p1  ORF type:complete len:505 (+),score=68.84 TRINITY_DN13180_c1_g1_i1:61-1575(+)